MALDDFVEPEVGVAVVVTAAVASPRVRKAIRQGLVYGLAGLLMAGDKLRAAASGVAQKAREVAHSDGGTQETSKPNIITSEGYAQLGRRRTDSQSVLRRGGKSKMAANNNVETNLPINRVAGDQKEPSPNGAAAEGQADDRMARAEQMVDHLAEKVARFTSVLGRKILWLGARLREEAEDIWAEAQNIRRGDKQ